MVGEWKKVSMKDNLEILTGYAFSSKNFNEEEGIPLIRIRDLETHNPVTLYKGDHDDKYIINKGDILVGMDGEFNIVRWKGPKALLNQRVAKINSKNPDIISEDFIFYRLQGELRKIEALTPATTVKHLSKKDIEDLNLLLPPLGEQSKIASILSSVDKAIEKTEAIIEQTEKVKKGLMQQLLTKGIGHTKFKKTEIGEIPEEWEVRRLDDIFEFYGGMPFSRSVLGDEGAFYLHYGDIHKMNKSAFDTSIDSSWLPRLDISKEEIREYSLLKTGDIVFADASEDTEGIGKSVVIINDDNKPFISGLHTIIAREKEVTLDDRYKEYCFSNPLVKKQFIRIATGATVYGISKTNIKQIKIPVPPIEEQRTIAKALKGLDNKIRNEKEKLEPLINIKKALMQVLLTGKVRVKVDDEVMSQ